MNRPRGRNLVLAAAGAAVVAVIAWGFVPKPVAVETATVSTGPLWVTVEEEGVTRVEDRFLVTSPVAAFLRRIELEPGDRVRPGQPIASLEAPREAILDPRARDEVVARVAAARAGVARTTQQARAAGEAAAQAARDRDRFQQLLEAGAVARQAAEQAAVAAAEAAAAREAANALVASARAELSVAERALRAAGAESEGSVRRVLTAPAAGTVLAVHRRSEGMVAPGEPLVEIGDPERLEVHVRVRSQDAVRIRPGTRVLLDQWGGDAPLEGVVRRVDPEGSTVVSSLGVEEQRVTVVADVPAGAGSGLGSGYRVLARFVVWEGEDVVRVPAAALFRVGDGWAAFVVEEGRAVRRTVRIGQQAGLVTEVLEGLRPGDDVIVHPGNAVAEGTRVRADRD
jgi:HlyD family secretion protein